MPEEKQAEDILEKGKADLILQGRESLREPYFALKAAAVLEDDVAWPLQYLRVKLQSILAVLVQNDEKYHRS